MKPEQISDALANLDESLITETDKLRRGESSLRKKRVRQTKNPLNLSRLGMLAACLCLLVINGMFLKYFLERPTDPDPTEAGSETSGTKEPDTEASGGKTDTPIIDTDELLATLTLSGSFGNLGSGFDTVVHRRLSDYVNLSPWTQEAYNMPSAIPVYENRYYTEDYVPYGFGRKEMEQTLERIVSGLGTTLTDSSYTEATQYVGAYLTVTTELASIKIDSEGTIVITFNPFELPVSYRVEEGMSDERLSITMDYLFERIGGILDFTEPVIDYYDEYNYLGECRHRYKVYEGAGDVVDDLLNRQYNFAEFFFTETGDLESIRIENGLSCAVKLADYEIINWTDAKNLLLQGHFFSQGNNDFVLSENLIADYELIYPSSNQPEMIIPYYCFYVECPTEELTDSNGKILTTYRKCYVPAVKAEYIENMPTQEVKSTVEEEILLYDRIMAAGHLQIHSWSHGTLLDTEDPGVIAECAQMFEGWSVIANKQDALDMELEIVVYLDDNIIILYSENSDNDNQYYGNAYYNYEAGKSCSLPKAFDEYIDSLLAGKESHKPN